MGASRLLVVERPAPFKGAEEQGVTPQHGQVEEDIATSAVGDVEGDRLAREELGGRFVNTSRDGFKMALDISCYSLIALAKRALPLMPNGGSMMAMTYYGAEKVTPNYNVMGVAKAALEATVRYLAWDLGKNRVRVNAISAGPIKTLAAAGISGFRKSLGYVGSVAPMGNVTQEDIGNAARYLLSDWSTGVTGEVHYVDGGYNIMGAPDLDDDEA